MNREEFDIWQKGIYETINEASINGLSQIKGDVGTHNNRTPEQIKANNEKLKELVLEIKNGYEIIDKF